MEMKTLKLLTLLAALVVFSAFALGSVFFKWDFTKTYGIGSAVDDFMLNNIDGKYVSLSDYSEAEGFILVFTSDRCPYSRGNEEKLEFLNKKYEPQGYHLMAIDPTISGKDIFNKLRTHISEKKFPFPYLLDEGQEVARKFGVTKVPQVFVLQKEGGEYLVKYRGAMHNSAHPNFKGQNSVVMAMEVLLHGGEMKSSSIKSAGCTLGSPRTE